jgi:hypothetical protein
VEKMERNDLATERFEAEKLDRDPNQGPTEEPWIDFTKPGQWEEGGGIYRHKPCGIFRPPMYLNPEVYPNRNVLRFPKRPQIGKNKGGVRWGEFKGKPPFLEKFIDPLVKVVDATDEFSTRRPPQYTFVPQKVDPHKPGPPYHCAVASGDKKVSLKQSCCVHS